MPHVLVTGIVDRPETKVFGLSQKDLECVTNFLQPSGGRIGQDGQMFQYPPTQMSHPHECKCGHSSSVSQTLDELDFERGIWFAAQYNDMSRVNEFINKGVCVNVEDHYGYTALHYASRLGHIDLCRLLLNAGANVNCTTRSGKTTPLHRAVSSGREEVVTMLLERGGDPYLQDADGKTILHRAAEEGHKRLVEVIFKRFPLLIDVKDSKGNLAYNQVEQ